MSRTGMRASSMTTIIPRKRTETITRTREELSYNESEIEQEQECGEKYKNEDEEENESNNDKENNKLLEKIKIGKKDGELITRAKSKTTIVTIETRTRGELQPQRDRERR